MNDKELAQRILELVGGEVNLSDVTHCVTRLRLSFKDSDKIQSNEISALPGVLGVNAVGNQFQVILGGKVTSVYEAFTGLVSLCRRDSVENEETKGRLVDRFLDTLSGIFVPIIPAIIGAGMIKGVLYSLMFFGVISADSENFQVINVFSDATFYFIPILVANSTANRFKVNPYIAMTIAGILIHPTMVELMTKQSSVHLFGIPFTSASYSSSVLPMIMAVGLQIYVERFLKRYVPKILQTLLVPLLTILIVAPIVLGVLGPLGTIIGNGIGQIFIKLYMAQSWLAGAVLSALYPFMVILGMHVGFTPVIVQNLSQYGVDYLMALFVASNAAQAGATFAVFMKTRNKDFKATSGTAAFNAFLGITEPALFGVTSRLKRPLIAVAVGGAVGGAIAGFFRVEALGMGTGPIAGLPLFFGKTFVYYMISWIVALVIAFALTYILGFDDSPEKDGVVNNDIAEGEKIVTQVLANQTITAPLSGQIIALSELPDAVFASGAMGQGAGILPNEGKVFAPCDGSVELVFDTKHAIGLKSLDGAEILIHVGMNTVELNGAPFTAYVTAGQVIKRGDLLLEFDIPAIQAAGKEIITPVIVTNSADFTSVKVEGADSLVAGQDFLDLTV